MQVAGTSNKGAETLGICSRFVSDGYNLFSTCNSLDFVEGFVNSREFLP